MNPPSSAPESAPAEAPGTAEAASPRAATDDGVTAPGAVEPFGARLRAAIEARGHLCVGIDPHPELLKAWGLPDSPDGLERFCRTAVEALAGQVAVVKPQSAFFERLGSRGVAVLETVIAESRDAGCLVLLDAKRGDIGSTVAAYATAYLDPASPLCADAVTATPYLGFGSLDPMLTTARRHGRGVFVLVATSNPEGATVQRAVGADGRSVAAAMMADIAAQNAGAAPLGSVGAVIGATLKTLDLDLTTLNGPVLAPGVGAQGGTPAAVARLFGPAARNVLPSASREVLRAGPDVAALRAAARDLAQQYADAIR